MAEATGPMPSVFDMDPNGIIDDTDVPEGTPESTDTPSSTTTPDEPAYDVQAPEDLPPELAARWEDERKKHQRNYSKQLERLRGDRKELDTYKQKALLVDKFYSDKQYAATTIQQMAQQLGYTLTPAHGAGTGTPPDVGRSAQPGSLPSSGAMPAEIAQAAEAALADSPDLAFLAPVIAKAAWSITQAATKPLQEEADARKAADAQRYQTDREAEFARMTTELEEEGVDWREHEDEMAERLAFLQNAIAGKGGWTHPKYGNFLRFLHTWTVGQPAAQAEAGQRLQRVMQNRTSTGTAARSPGVNTEQLIREAKTDQERWAIAFRAAIAEAPQPRR